MDGNEGGTPLDLTPVQKLLMEKIIRPFEDERSAAMAEAKVFDGRQWFRARAASLLHYNPFAVNNFLIMCDMWGLAELHDACCSWLMSLVESLDKDEESAHTTAQERANKRRRDADFIRGTICPGYQSQLIFEPDDVPPQQPPVSPGLAREKTHRRTHSSGRGKAVLRELAAKNWHQQKRGARGKSFSAPALGDVLSLMQFRTSGGQNNVVEQ